MQLTRKSIPVLLFLALTIGCMDLGVKDRPTDPNVPTSNFDLRNDLFTFSRDLEAFDTLQIVADLSVCTTWGHELNILTKDENEVFIKSFAEGEFLDKEEQEMAKVEYSVPESDTLSFESFFEYLRANDPKERKDSYALFSIICKNDTINFYSEGLIDRLQKIDYYRQIKRRIYPDIPMYQPVVVPAVEDEL